MHEFIHARICRKCCAPLKMRGDAVMRCSRCRVTHLVVLEGPNHPVYRKVA